MIRTGIDALIKLDRAKVGRMVDKPDTVGVVGQATYQIVDQGRWVADVTDKVAELLITRGLIEDLGDDLMDEPIYAITRRGVEAIALATVERRRLHKQKNAERRQQRTARNLAQKEAA